MRIKNCYGAKKIFFALGFIFLTFFSASLALAQSGNYVPLVPIPGVTGATGLLGYLSGLYNFLISVVGILAMAVIVYGGLRYLTSVGNPSAVESAKETIMSAIYGLILALVSWMILNTINPDTLLLKKPGVAGPSGTYGTVTFANKCIESPTGAGTVASPCVCLDGAKIQNLNATKTQTKLTLTVNPATIGNAVATTVTMSGKLTDASGAPISGMTIKVNRIATLINASNTYTAAALTNAAGDYTATMTFAAGGPGTEVGGDIMQAVFAGTALPAPGYAAVGSNTVIFTRNSASGTYLPTDYLYNTMGGLLPVATVFNNGYDCNATCSNKLLANDNKYHCLKLNVKKGWVGKSTGYTDEQFRALATTSTSATNPFVSYDGDEIVVEVERASTVLNTPAVYSFDYDGMGGTCEKLLDGTGGTGFGWYHGVSSYDAADGANDACSLTSNPKGETCAVKFCVTDSQGNTADTLLYYTILAP